MADEQIKKTLVIDLITGKTTAVAAMKELGKAVEGVQSNLKSLQKETQKAANTQDDLNEAVKDLDTSGAKALKSQMSEVSEEIATSNKEIQGFTDSVRKSVGEVENLANKTASVQSPGGDVNFGKDQVGDISSASGAIGSALGAVGGAGGQAAGQLIGDVTGAIEYLPALKSAVVDFATATGPVGAVVLGAAAAIGFFALKTIEAQKSFDQAIAASIKANADVERQIAEGLTSDEIRAQIEANNKSRAAEQEILDRETAARERANAAGGALIGIVNLVSDAEEANATAISESEAKIREFDAANKRLTASLEEGEAAENDYAAALEKSAGNQIDAFREVQAAIAAGLDTAGLKEQIDEVNRQIKVEGQVRAGLAETVGKDSELYKQSEEKTAALDAKLRELNSTTTQAGAAANTLIGGLQGATSGQVDLGDAISKTLEPLQKAVEAHNKVQAVLDSYDATKAETASKRTLAATQAAQDAAIKEAQVKEDRQQAQEEALASHQDKLQQIEANGLKAVEGIRKELADGIAKQLVAISDAEKDLTKLEADYNKQELARQKKFNDDKAQLEKKFKEDSADLIASGSFDALADLQRQNKDDKKNLRKEFKGGKSDAKDEFDEQKALAEEKIAALKTELEAFKTNEADKLKAAQEQTTAAIDAENKSFDDQEKKREAAYQKQDEREKQAADLRAQRLAEAQQREDAALDARTAKQLEAIGTVEARQIAATLSASTAFDQLDVSIGKLATSAATIGGTTTAANGGTSNPSLVTPPIKAYAKGGLIDKPTLALMGEKGKELVLPYEPSKGLPAALNQGFGGNGKGGGGGSVSAPIDASTTITIQGSVDAVTFKKLEHRLDQHAKQMARVINGTLHASMDGKEPV